MTDPNSKIKDVEGKESSSNSAYSLSQHSTTPAIDIPSTSHRSTSPNGSLPKWVAGASPVKFFTIDELLTINSTMEKMVLAHEIAVDPNFSLENLPKNPVEEQVKKVMHDAFWDKVKENFNKNPPDYGHIFTLITDLKEMMIGLLNEQQKNFREIIENGINLPVIKQQIDNGIFGPQILEFIIELLSKLCAPIRDEQLNDIKNESDVIKKLRKIFEFIELLKIDLANYTVTANRSTIEQYAAEYEKDKFMKILDINPTGNMGLKILYNDLLKEYITYEIKKQNELTNSQIKDIIVNFYMKLLENPEKVEIFPETLKIDENRIKALSEKHLQLILIISNIFVSSNIVGRDICESTGYKAELKKDLIVILNDVNKNNESEKIENAALQCISKSEAICGPNRFTPEIAATMKHQLLSLEDENNSIRKLARDRIYTFIKDIISTGGINSGQIRVPPGLSVITRELGALTGRYLHLVMHNWRAFGVYYGQLIEKEFQLLKK